MKEELKDKNIFERLHENASSLAVELPDTEDLDQIVFARCGISFTGTVMC